jgi:hypothetical protein
VTLGPDRSSRRPRPARWWIVAFVASLLVCGALLGGAFLRDFEGSTDWVWLIVWTGGTVVVSGALQWRWARTAARDVAPVTRRVSVLVGTLGPMAVGGLAVVLYAASQWPVQ